MHFALPRYTRNHRDRLKHLVFLCTAAFFAIAGSDVSAQGCETVRAYGAAPHTAEDYPLPLSARINLRRLMKREMHAIGRYDSPETVNDAVFHTLLGEELRRFQRERGEEPTGCITWSLVTKLDSKRRTPPQEAIEAFE